MSAKYTEQEKEQLKELVAIRKRAKALFAELCKAHSKGSIYCTLVRLGKNAS